MTIEIPTAFRRFTDGTPKIDCSAATIAEALNAAQALPGNACNRLQQRSSLAHPVATLVVIQHLLGDVLGVA